VTPPPPLPVATLSKEACFVLSDVSQNEMDSLERLFAEKLPAVRLLRTAMPGNSSYWVHIPSFRTRREAESRVEELKRAGIKEYFITQDTGDGYTISLGLFSTQKAAEFTLAALRDKGVRSARMIERPRRSTLSQIEILGPESQAMEIQQALGQALPQAKPGICDRDAAQ
jgi:cell division septation protein DedD